jgi:hypothetical protein
MKNDPMVLTAGLRLDEAAKGRGMFDIGPAAHGVLGMLEQDESPMSVSRRRAARVGRTTAICVLYWQCMTSFREGILLVFSIFCVLRKTSAIAINIFLFNL